jgi:hypothetical protein
MKKLPTHLIRKKCPVRFTPAEWEAIKKVSAHYGTPASTWTRDVVIEVLHQEVTELKKYDKRAFTKAFITELFEG